jgi:hypothetical protein
MDIIDVVQKDEYSQQIGTFEYLPVNFLGINTSTFTDSYIPDDKEHPFLSLKRFAMDNSISFEDRIQCVRYMCFIPYKEYVSHCVEASKTIIENDKYDIYNRYFFFANNSRNTKLDGHVVHELHPYFFTLSKERNYPLELTLMSARYIIDQYDYLSDERNTVLEYILDVADDKNESIYARSECADILITLGEGNEIIFGEQVIEELGDLYNENKNKTIYTNAQNAHNETINENTRNIVRALYKDYLKTKSYNDLIKTSYEDIHKELSDIDNSEENNDKLHSFFYRVMTDPFRFERLSLSDIVLLVYNKICSFENKNDLMKRLLEEILDCDNSCTTGYFTRIVNTLNGFINDKDMCFNINPRDELRSVIFARINRNIRSLPEKTRESVLEAIEEANFGVFEEFMDYYSPEDEIRKEYSGLIEEEEFNKLFSKCVDEFIGKI